nr:MAG TPA: hypothetical protein [Caudoviricetes sp.]
MTKQNVKVKIQLCHRYPITGTQRIMKRPRSPMPRAFCFYVDNIRILCYNAFITFKEILYGRKNVLLH